MRIARQWFFLRVTHASEASTRVGRGATMRSGFRVGIPSRKRRVAASSGADVTAPTLSSAVINAAGTSLTLTYNEALDTGSVPALGAFTLAGTILAALTGTPNVTGSTVVLTLAPGVTVGETGITISYTAGGSPIQDLAGNDAANLVTQAVTNNSTRAYSPADEGNLVWWGEWRRHHSARQQGDGRCGHPNGFAGLPGHRTQHSPDRRLQRNDRLLPWH
jgi:hypothetical protein